MNNSSLYNCSIILIILATYGCTSSPRTFNSYDYERYFKKTEIPTKQMQLDAIAYDEYLIQHIKNPSEEVQLASVQKDGHTIQHIKNPSIKVQLAAVRENPSAILGIENPSEEVQLATVRHGGEALRYIKNPSKNVQLAALNQDVQSVRYIESPDKEIQLKILEKKPLSKDLKVYFKNTKKPNKELQIYAMEHMDGDDILECISGEWDVCKNLHPDAQLAAFRRGEDDMPYRYHVYLYGGFTFPLYNNQIHPSILKHPLVQDAKRQWSEAIESESSAASARSNTGTSSTFTPHTPQETCRNEFYTTRLPGVGSMVQTIRRVCE